MSTKAKKHLQMFRKEYSLEWPVLVRSNKSTNYVFCQVCKSDFSIAHGGRNDCLRHIEGARHRSNGAASSSSKDIKTMFSASTKESQNVIRAEALFVKFLTEHNLPLAVADHAGPLFKRMFPDSAIAAKFQCARKKSTEICKSFANTTQEDLAAKIRKQKFSLATDGSNSTSGDKLFPIVITFFDEEKKKIFTSLLCLPNLDKDATGENIFNLMDEELTKRNISWENCVAFCADNAYTMLGKNKGVSSFIQKKNPNIIIHGCACHLIHLAAKHATKKIDFDIENFLIDVFYYLKKSSKRGYLLKICEELCNLDSSTKVAKYGATRWLSMGKTIDRFLEKWEALKKNFCEEEKGSSDTFHHLKSLFEDKLTKLYLFFLQAAIPLFESCNVMMQQEAPLVHKYQRELMNLFTNILSRFMKPASISDEDSMLKNIKIRKHQKENTELVIGSKARQYIKGADLTTEETDTFYFSVRKFYEEALCYIVKKFPLTSNIYKHCEIADITIRRETKSSSLEYFFNLFSIPVDQQNDIEQEFAVFQMDKLNDDILSAERCDEAWASIAALVDINGAKKYKTLPGFMHNVLLLPHSNAACERIFSLVKKNLTEFRASLSLSTLEALLVEKCINKGTCCYDVVFTEADLVKAKKATYLSLTEKTN